MGAKTQALKNAARRRMAETGQSYEAALQDVRREYAQGNFADDGPERDPYGFEEASGREEYRPPTSVTGYFFAWGARELAGEEQLGMLTRHAEQYGKPGSEDPIVCHLCDKPIAVTYEPEVHVGLVLREVVRPGETRTTELQMPVWTHESCGKSRVWSWSQLTLERRRRGLPVETADLPPKLHRRGNPVEDYFVFSTPEDSPPVFYLQPGEANRHGALGFRADRLSDGLAPLDLTREDVRAMPEWRIVVDPTGLTWIEREGTGRWYQPPRPWSPPTEWLAAAHYHQVAVFLTAPAGSVPPAQMDACTGDLSALLAVGRSDVLFGARMAITGL